MKLSHRKAFKLIIDIQSKPISKSKQTRLDAHVKICKECQDFLEMKLDMQTTLPWKESNNSRQRATQIKNAVRRDTRRYYMFSRLSKTVKTIAFIGIIGIAMSAIIMTKNNIEVTPASVANTKIIKSTSTDNKSQDPSVEMDNKEIVNGNFPVSIWTAQENINFEIKIPLNLEEDWTHLTTDINTEDQAIFFEFLRNNMTEGFPNKLYISQEKLDAFIGLENLLRRHLSPARDEDILIPFQQMKVNEFDALFLNGWFLGPDGFSNETNQSMLSWLEGNILFTIRYFGDNVLSNLELLEIAENMESFVQLLAKSEDSLMHSADDATVLARILRTQPGYDFELRIPTDLRVGWDSISAGENNVANEIKEFALNFERSIIGSITSYLTITQGEIDAETDINELIETLYNIPSNMVTWQSVEVNGHPAKFLKGWYLPEGGFDTSISRLEILWIEDGIYYSVVYSVGDIMSFNNLLIIAESLIPHSQYFEK